MDTIDGMRTFVAVADASSFTAGARRLGISTRLASKYVRQLEARLDAQLFNRTTRQVTLTDTGQAYRERCRPLLEQFDELEGLVQASQTELAGRIRISAPTAFGSHELVDALRPFLQRHPKVSVDLNLSDQHVALIEDGIDLAIRFGALQDSSLIARRLMTMRLVVFASPDYLATHGEPEHPDELSAHDCLSRGHSGDPDHWQFRLDGRTVPIRVSGSFHANSPKAIAHMAAGGLGIGRAPFYVVESLLATGALRLLFEDKETSGLALQAVYPPSRHLTARIRALIDHLVAWHGERDKSAQANPPRED